MRIHCLELQRGQVMHIKNRSKDAIKIVVKGFVKKQNKSWRDKGNIGNL